MQCIRGYGPIVVSVFLSEVGDGNAYRSRQNVSAAQGLVHAQHRSGGEPCLLGISKRCSGYLCSLLVHGARSVFRLTERQEPMDRLNRWARGLKEKRTHTHKATVALANKMGRTGRVILN